MPTKPKQPQASTEVDSVVVVRTSYLIQSSQHQGVSIRENDGDVWIEQGSDGIYLTPDQALAMLEPLREVDTAAKSAEGGA